MQNIAEIRLPTEQLNTAQERWRGDVSLLRQNFCYDDIESWISFVGDCRSGSSPFQRVLARLGIPSIYQPGKAALRSIEAEQEPEFIRYSDFGLVVGSKETIGGPRLTDCLFNPLDVHLKGDDGQGIEKERIKMILSVRNPFDNYRAWTQRYLTGFHAEHSQVNREDLLEFFVAAHSTFMSVYEQVNALGINHVVFPQEFLGEQSPEDYIRRPNNIVQQVLHNVGLDFELDRIRFATTAWPELTEEEARRLVHFPREPKIDFTGAILNSFNRVGYQYYANDWRKAAQRLQPHEILRLSDCCFVKSYNSLLKQAGTQLGVYNYGDLLINQEEVIAIAEGVARQNDLQISE